MEITFLVTSNGVARDCCPVCGWQYSQDDIMAEQLRQPEATAESLTLAHPAWGMKDRNEHRSRLDELITEDDDYAWTT